MPTKFEVKKINEKYRLFLNGVAHIDPYADPSDLLEQCVNQLQFPQIKARGDDIEELSDNFFCVNKDVALVLFGETLTSANVWVQVGYLVRGANCDLDGSGLSLWGDSRNYVEWSQCWSDGQSDGRTELADALQSAFGEMLADDDDWINVVTNFDFFKVVSQNIEFSTFEPTAEDIFYALGNSKIDIGHDFEVRYGKWCGIYHIVACVDGRYVVSSDSNLEDLELPWRSNYLLSAITSDIFKDER